MNITVVNDDNNKRLSERERVYGGRVCMYACIMVNSDGEKSCIFSW